MSETYVDQVRRVRLMASGSPTWDLSDNDTAALTAVLKRLEEQGVEIAALQARESTARQIAEDLIEPELRKDKARLDWLEKALRDGYYPFIGIEAHAGGITNVTAVQEECGAEFTASGIREALDAAMEKHP